MVIRSKYEVSTFTFIIHHSFLIKCWGLEIDRNRRHSFGGCHFELLKTKVNECHLGRFCIDTHCLRMAMSPHCLHWLLIWDISRKSTQRRRLNPPQRWGLGACLWGGSGPVPHPHTLLFWYTFKWKKCILDPLLLKTKVRFKAIIGRANTQSFRFLCNYSYLQRHWKSTILWIMWLIKGRNCRDKMVTGLHAPKPSRIRSSRPKSIFFFFYLSIYTVSTP